MDETSILPYCGCNKPTTSSCLRAVALWACRSSVLYSVRMGCAVDMVQICLSVCDFCLVILLAVTVARQSIAVVPVLCAGRHMHALLVKVKDCTRICHPLAAHLLEKQWVEGLFGALGLSRQIEFKAALHARGDLSGSDRAHTSHPPFNITLFRNTLSRAARNWRCATSTAFFSLPAVL